MRVVALTLTLLMLGACGRVGAVRPPGPREAITYPRIYPAPDPPPAAVQSRPAPPTNAGPY